MGEVNTIGNVWTRAIFDGLEQHDGGRVFFLSAIYFPLLAASVCVMLVQVHTRMGTQRRWRAWLNAHLLDRWLKNGRYYQLNFISGDHKNPEYRIAEDVRYQAASAFTTVQTAFNWLVDNYPRFADWSASAVRVASLMVSLDSLERAESGEGFARIERSETRGRGRAPATRPFGDAMTAQPWSRKPKWRSSPGNG